MTWILHTAAGVDEVNHHLAALTAADMLGTVEVDGGTDVYVPQRVADLPIAGSWEHVADRDWHARWRERLTPVTAGRWVITPSWLASGADDELVIDPGQAFGTGHHETTAACLRALDDVTVDGRAVLDLGTGSGVLAIAAARRGAQPVVAVDTDPLAVAAARDNARRNRAPVDVRHGDVEVVTGERFDVVVANLDTATLTRLAPTARSLLADGGILIASGVANAHADTVADALRDAGLPAQVTVGDEWCVLRARRTPTRQASAHR